MVRYHIALIPSLKPRAWCIEHNRFGESCCHINGRENITVATSPYAVAVRISMEPIPCDKCMDRLICQIECHLFKAYVNGR